ncbi:MAG: hypothetical protein HOM34_01425 [Planctomycetes bacterium]|jgi:hypothetical protein|nr:hypothetical protein [Planctomycetota bacterium]MBT4029335.1 hypothetical protein [Planctomycetota bacterium]MBT4560820.1 hypothetical protein [Planctomycetota bacterium]MBT5101642.1 hypothetical protein [Planctomycetota bacterium]MBT5119362.1 hypothetical protein [Planctomycetota bacterium]
MISIKARTRRYLFAVRITNALILSAVAFASVWLHDLPAVATIASVSAFAWVLYHNPPWSRLPLSIHPGSDARGFLRAALSVADDHPHAEELASMSDLGFASFHRTQRHSLIYYASFCSLVLYLWVASEPVKPERVVDLAQQFSTQLHPDGQSARLEPSATRQYEQVPQDAAELPMLLSGRNFGNEQAAVERFVQLRLARKASAE